MQILSAPLTGPQLAKVEKQLDAGKVPTDLFLNGLGQLTHRPDGVWLGQAAEQGQSEYRRRLCRLWWGTGRSAGWQAA